MIQNILSFLPLFIGFFIIALSAERVAGFFKRLHLPGITGALLTGIIAGPYFLDFISHEVVDKLHFLNEVSLSFIAFYAGTELYLKEIRDRIKNIIVETAAFIITIFVIGGVVIYNIADLIPFMNSMSSNAKIAVALLMATIFIARSPSSALAVIKEMRAKGPFVKTAMSITVIIDFIVIVLFSVTLSLALNFTSGVSLNFIFIIDVLIELIMAFVFGLVFSKIITFVFNFSLSPIVKSAFLLLLGYVIYAFLHYVKVKSIIYLPFELHIEPLLVCIVAGFIITNHTSYRKEFKSVLHILSPYVYIVFFTLTGAHLAMDYFILVWQIALLLFFIRSLAVIIGSFIGATINKEKILYKTTSWTAGITQAGVGIGLATVVSRQFPEWGKEFYTLILSVIVLNEIVGPMIFKFGIKRMKESHLKHENKEKLNRKVLIFGMEPQSVALARQLQTHDWEATIVTRRDESKLVDTDGVNFETIDDHTIENLRKIKCNESGAVVLMLEDEENLKLAELIYEQLGTKEIIARIKDRTYLEEFKELGVMVVEPYTSMVSLMDNLVRSPNATSILLGHDKNQETLDIEIRDKKFHGMSLKYLRLPGDVLILSIKRKDQVIATHGHTRLKVGDIVTAIGSHQSLEDMLLDFSE